MQPKIRPLTGSKPQPFAIREIKNGPMQMLINCLVSLLNWLSYSEK